MKSYTRLFFFFNVLPANQRLIDFARTSEICYAGSELRTHQTPSTKKRRGKRTADWKIGSADKDEKIVEKMGREAGTVITESCVSYMLAEESSRRKKSRCWKMGTV